MYYICISETGSWATFKIWNIPWIDDFLDFNSNAFKNAKYIIERAVSIYINIKWPLICILYENSFIDGYGFY